MALRVPATDESDVNMAPLIDVVFNLLIFFLLGSTILNEERELELTLPNVAEAAPLTEAPDDITVNVLPDGAIKIGGETLESDELLRRLVAARENYPDQAVAVRGDADVRYQAVASVIAVCRKAGIKQLDVLVLQEE